MDTDTQGDTSIGELVSWHKVVNVVERLPVGERWTHFFKGNSQCGVPEAYRQLDYILLSKSLADDNKNAKPKIIRNGLPKRADLYDGPRFQGIGQNNPKASDHCPVVIELEI
jgi:predicted extracellular nuclease